MAVIEDVQFAIQVISYPEDPLKVGSYVMPGVRCLCGKCIDFTTPPGQGKKFAFMVDRKSAERFCKVLKKEYKLIAAIRVYWVTYEQMAEA